MESLGEKIKNIRISNNLKQSELADILHISEKTISSWENDRTTPDLNMIYKISDYFKKSFYCLINDELDTENTNEIEIKLKVNEEEYSRILNIIKNNSVNKRNVNQIDTYYTLTNKKLNQEWLRIRNENGKYIFNYKKILNDLAFTEKELLESICGLLGGRVAEEVTFGEITTGAHDDFKKATKIARSMVTEYGMSNLGPMMLEEPDGNTFLGRDYTKNRNISDTVAHEIDEEMRSIINSCYEKTKKIISENKDLLSLIANTLLEEETITKEEIDYLVEHGHLPKEEKKEEQQEEVKQTKEENKKIKKNTKKEDTKNK